MIYPNKGQVIPRIITGCISLILIFNGVFVLAQAPPNDDCSNAQVLCAGDTLRGTTEGAINDFASDCILSNPAVWYTFTTNGDRNGNVKVNIIRDLLCSIPGSTGDSLQGVILQSTDPLLDPCADPSLFLEVSDCAIGDDIFNITLPAALPNTQYWVQIGGAINDQGLPTTCKFSISISGLPVQIYAGTDKLILKGDTVMLNAAGPDPGTFFWNNTGSLTDENTLSPIAKPNETTEYTLTGDIGDCKNLTDVVRVSVVDEGVDPRNLIIPTSTEDLQTWKIVRISEFPEAVVEVFNRWGQRVFVSIGYDNSNGWDGTRNGNQLPEGTYYYVIQLNRSDLLVENVQTGFVAIVR